MFIFILSMALSMLKMYVQGDFEHPTLTLLLLYSLNTNYL